MSAHFHAPRSVTRDTNEQRGERGEDGSGSSSSRRRAGGDSPKLVNVAAWQLLNQLDSEILIQFPIVLVRHEAGFDCPNICHLSIPVWQLPESLLADNLFHKQLVDTGVKTLPK
jgi:hypothetical protein